MSPCACEMPRPARQETLSDGWKVCADCWWSYRLNDAGEVVDRSATSHSHPLGQAGAAFRNGPRVTFYDPREDAGGD